MNLFKDYIIKKYFNYTIQFYIVVISFKLQKNYFFVFKAHICFLD